jgi:hypothetical protein
MTAHPQARVYCHAPVKKLHGERRWCPLQIIVNNKNINSMIVKKHFEKKRGVR